MSVGYHLKQTSAETQAAIDKIIALQPGELDEIGIYNHDSLYWEEHSDFIPALGAFVVYTDEVKFKMGDGVKTVAELDFLDADLEQAISNLSDLLATKQDTLVSGENIKTINGQSILGEGNITAGDPNAVKYTEQTLTAEQKAQARENIGATASEIFWATYGTTTGAEIDAAIAEGKTVYCKYGSATSWSIYRLVRRYSFTYEFSCLEGNENYRLRLNRNGTWSTEYTYLIDTDSVYIAKEYTYVTYSELVEMRDNWNLTRGAYYCITDYVTTTSDPESRSLAHPFYIIVQALGNGVISEEAFAARALNTLDGYFSGTNFDAWKIWYCLDNDTSRFTWADTVNGKGVIYRMIDEWNNDLPYDFKNIQFKRYVVASVNATYTEALTPLIGLPIALSGTRSKGLVAGTDFKWYFTFSRLGDAWTDDVTDGSLEGGRAAHSVVFAPNTDDTRASRLCHNVFADGAASFNFMKTLNANTNAGPNSICYDSKFKGDACEDNTVIGYIYGGDISSDFCSNTIVGAFRVMNVGGAMMNNTMLFDRDALCLSFGHMCSDNIIRVTLAQYCHFGHYFRRNYIFLSNTLSSSTFGDSIYDNVIKGEQIQAVRCGNLCIRNTFTNINMSASQIEGQFNDNELIGRFRECFIGAITSWCIFAGGTGNDFFSNVDVRGNIRGASGSELRIESNNFITADISGVKRHISLEGDTNGNLVATWYSAGKRVGIYKAPSDADWTPLPEAYFKPSGGIPASDLASGVIPDVSNFITNTVDDLVNYYLKSETYTKAEVATLINAVQQFTYESVATLPTASAETMHKIYLVPSADPQTANVKDEFITIDNSNGGFLPVHGDRYTWEQIGSTAIDLSGYVTTTALNTALANYTTTADLTTLLAGKQDNLIVEVGGMERNNVSGGGSITITGTRGQFPRVTRAGTYRVITQMQSTTQSYGLSVTFGSNSYTLNTTNGVIEDERELTLAANAAWSGAVVGSVGANSYIYISVVGQDAITSLSTVAVSGNYNDLSNKPTIPSVPAISTDIAADASSDSKTASPKAVANYVDATAVLGPLDNDIFGRTANEELTIKNGGITKAKLATAVQNELIPSGGSAGQVLKKTSATDFDVAWANESAGVEYFDATYDVTTGAELKAAYAAGKVLRVLDDGAIYQLGYWGISGTPETWQNEDLEAVFYYIDDSGNAQFTGTIRVATEGQNTTWSRREVTNVEYFDAIYNVTTGAEIKAAVAAGKTLRVIDDGLVYQLSYWALNGTPEVWQDFDASFSCVESYVWETSYINTIYVYSDGPNSTHWSREAIDVSALITNTVDDLVNYYTKSQTYTKSEVQTLINAVKQFTYEVVATLPTASADTMHKIYLVPSSDPQTQNVKDEFITIESSGSYSWEQIGSTAIDLSGYVTTTALNTALANYTTTTDLTTLLAGKQDVIDAQHKLDYSLLDNTPTIPAPEVFWATYGTTTAAEIDAATTAGKKVFLIDNGIIYTHGGEYSGYHYFFAVIGNISYRRIQLQVSTGNWARHDIAVQGTSYRVSSWSATPNNNNYPSEKLVKDSLDAIHQIPSGGTAGQVLKKATGTDYDVAWGDESGGGSSNAVEYVQQSLTDAQKAQARENIDAFGSSDVEEITVVDIDLGTPVATTMPQGGMLPNVVYDLGVLSSATTFTLAAAADTTIANIWHWSFETGSTAPSITWPTGLTWRGGGTPPTINASSLYEIQVRLIGSRKVAFYEEIELSNE